MKKRRPKSNLSSHAEFTAGDGIYFRLCHICLHLNESSSEVVKCDSCHQQLSLAGEWEKRLSRVETRWRQDSEEDDEAEGISPDWASSFPGLTGLSVLW